MVAWLPNVLYICKQKLLNMEFYHLYPIGFQNLLKKKYASDSYIGQGNPASKILIIGKECSCDKDNFDVKNNAEIWRTISPENIENWFDSGWDWKKYHPRQPFKGQLLLRDNRNDIIEKNNRGTSVTWMAYQNFINMLLPKDSQVQAKQQLNFYEHCFLTELSSKCMRTSRKNLETKKSIAQRLSPNGILAHPFFKQFPVVILGVYRYIDWYKEIPIIQTFDGGVMNYIYKGIVVSEEEYSHYDEKTKESLPLYRTNNGFKKGEFINVHESADGKHLLLHTNHFVDNYRPRSDFYLKELADLVRPYMNNN